jgi:hypothetical protein
MAELADSMIPQANPMAQFQQGAESGMATGMDWATQKAGLDLKQQTVNDQLANTKLMQDKFHVEVGKQKMAGYDSFASLPNDSPLKKVKAAQWKDNWTQPGMPDAMTEDQADQHIAAANDPAIQMWWNKMYDSLKSSDPQTQQAGYIGAGTRLFNSDADPEMFKNYAQNLAMIQAAHYKAQQTDDRQATRISAQELNKSLSSAQTATANDQNVLGTIKRLHDIADAVKSGKIVGTAQVLNSLNTEKTKVEMGSNKLTEGSMERGRSNSVDAYLSNKLSQVANMPKDANIKAFADQLEKESDAVGSQYQKDIDTHHEMLREGMSDYPQAQKGLDRTFGALRKNVASPEVLGQWDGLNKYKIAPAKADKKDTPPPPVDTKSLQAAAQFKQAYDKMTDPAKKKIYLQKAIQQFGQDAVSKVGMQ